MMSKRKRRSAAADTKTKSNAHQYNKATDYAARRAMLAVVALLCLLLCETMPEAIVLFFAILGFLSNTLGVVRFFGLWLDD